MKTKTVMLLALVTLSEATIGVFVKLTNGNIPIQTLNFYALACAAAFLLVTLPRATGNRNDFPSDNLKDTIIIGVLIAVQISVFNLAMTLAPIANVVIFWSVAPFFTFIFSAVFLGERAKWSYIAIFAIALTGIVLAKPLSGDAMVGNLVALGDGAIYAGMITYMRYEGKSESDNDIAWSMLVAAIVLLPMPFIFGPGSVLATTTVGSTGIHVPAFVWALCLGVASTGFAYLGISLVMKRVDANTYSLVDVIVSPVVASLLGFVIFGEVPSIGMIFGGALLLGSGFWLTYEMKQSGTRASNRPSSATGTERQRSG